MTQNGSTPDWFRRAWDEVPTKGCVDVDGCRVHHLLWEPSAPSAEPPLVLVHGTGAHAHWWAHVGSMLAADRRVIAMELSGHGDSDHRERYSIDLWADELLAVAEVVDPAQAGVCIAGHSLGGMVATFAAGLGRRPIRGVVQIECIPDNLAAAERGHTGPPPTRRYYGSFEQALGRFREVPSQPGTLPFVLERIGPLSVVEYPEGWSWKYDHRLVEGMPHALPTVAQLLPNVPCPVTLIRGEHGLVLPADAAALQAAFPERFRSVELPESGHHPMLDQPLALVAAMRALLTTWPGPPPTRSRGDVSRMREL